MPYSALVPVLFFGLAAWLFFRGGWITFGIVAAIVVGLALWLASMVAGAHDPASAGAGIMVGVFVLGPLVVLLAFRFIVLMSR